MQQKEILYNWAIISSS